MLFTELPLTDSLLEGLDAMNFKETTPIQEQAIPILLKKKDVIACAQTGTGKTAAFLLPLLNNLQTDDHDQNKVNAIIMAPTRELAQQIDQMMEGFSYYTPFSSVAVYGGNDGEAWDVQKKGLLNGADVVISTPGRLLSHINLYNIDFSGVKYFILDEADRMLDMGFYDDIMKIVKLLPKDRQTVMFSATMPPKIQQMAKTILRNPEEITISVAKPPESIIQSSYICYESQKMEILKLLFKNKKPHKVILFSGKKQKVKEIAKTLQKMDLSVGEMHSDLDQSQREHVMREFKNERIDILVATDIVSRGIDIDDITLVINFDVPYDVEDYVHRIGRTARAGDSGMAITFVSPEDQHLFEKIEQFLQKKIYRIPVPSELGETPEYNPEEFRKQKGTKRNSSKRRSSTKPGGNDKREKVEKSARSGNKQRKGYKNRTIKGSKEESVNNVTKENENLKNDLSNKENSNNNQNRKRNNRNNRKRKPVQENTQQNFNPAQGKVKSNKQDSNDTTPAKSTNKRLVKKKDLNRSDISAAETGNKGVSAEVKSGKGKDTGSRKMKAVAKKQDSAKVKNESVKQQEKTAKKKWWSWWPFGSK
ncbi:dead/deah box helicase domain-containing protein [Fermentimonas caenicola]|uniref:Dead/deah box helicase domain-containing protein n=1 Tax=Fermentimonas caenicola TaxID=1562970 RepID=A0A098BWX7_9BACT|nr:dead/deah box helicase domain-containing protein [Fermentimonas caenicola]